MERSIAERLIKLRKKNNYSQTFVARRIGVTPALISAIEKQERNPSIDTLIALADIYHVSTDYLLGRTYNDDSSKLINVSHLTDIQIRILRDLIENMNQKNWCIYIPINTSVFLFHSLFFTILLFFICIMIIIFSLFIQKILTFISISVIIII